MTPLGGDNDDVDGDDDDGDCGGVGSSSEPEAAAAVEAAAAAAAIAAAAAPICSPLALLMRCFCEQRPCLSSSSMSSDCRAGLLECADEDECCGCSC